MATISFISRMLLVVWMQRLKLYRPVLPLRSVSQRRSSRMRLVSSLKTATTSSVGMLTSASHATRRAVSRSLTSLKSPQAQLLSAIGGCVGGAALIGTWMVGIVLMLGAVAWGADAFLRDDGKQAQPGTHEAVLERFRRAS